MLLHVALSVIVACSNKFNMTLAQTIEKYHFGMNPFRDLLLLNFYVRCKIRDFFDTFTWTKLELSVQCNHLSWRHYSVKCNHLSWRHYSVQCNHLSWRHLVQYNYLSWRHSVQSNHLSWRHYTVQCNHLSWRHYSVQSNHLSWRHYSVQSNHLSW